MKILAWPLLFASALFFPSEWARAEIEADRWAAFRFLVGEWTGEGSGQPGQAKGGFSFRPDLAGRVMVRRNRAEVTTTAGLPPTIHEDLMVVYPAARGQPLRAVYFDNEDHIINYTVQGSENPRTLTFESESDPRTPRYRLIYTLKGEDRVGITFAIAPPGKPEEFKTYIEASARRKSRSNVGISLPRGYVSYRAVEPLTIDGKLDDRAWQAAPWTEAFVDIEGDLKPLPRFQTRAKMLWNDEYFYIGAYLEEPHVWGTLTKHDAVIFQDNDFEIFIDPDGDNHEYYEIEINALGTEWDLFLKKPYRDGGSASNEWEIQGLRTATHVEGTLNDPKDKDQYWSVEFAIPWKALAEHAHCPAPPRDGEQWRINFSRVEWLHELVAGKYGKVPKTREDNWVWSPQGVIDMHRPESWGVVQFSTAMPGTVSFRPDWAGPIRDRLIEVYRAQRRFHYKHKRWAEKLDLLDLSDQSAYCPPHTLTIHPTADGFEALLTIQRPSGGGETWSIHQDSKLERKQ
jgi:hypothetical protein